MQEIQIHSVSISKKGQMQFFEIPIPRNVAFITAIDYRFRVTDEINLQNLQKGQKDSPFQPEPMVGTLSLSSTQREGLFFYGNLILETKNAGMLDYSAGFFQAYTFNRDPMPLPLQVKVDGKTTSVNGFFKDSLGISQQKDIEYEVSIYLHFEIKKP